MAKHRVHHNMSRTPEYKTRVRAISRCLDKNNPSYHLYGGRGITVCEAWLDSFEAFYRDMGPRPSSQHSIERIDNNGNYEPSNCKWATPLEQGRNRRNNRLITHDGETLCLTEWAIRVGITKSQLVKRIVRWGVTKALTTPKKFQHDCGQALLRHYRSNRTS